MENVNLSSFVAKRKKEILNNIKVLREELAQLRAVERAFISPQPQESKPDSGRKKGGMTFQEMIVEILAKLPLGADAHQLLDLIKRDFGKSIMRSSLSPQLSRLKANGVLELNDGVWNLKNRALQQKNKAPEGALDTVDAVSDLQQVPLTNDREG